MAHTQISNHAEKRPDKHEGDNQHGKQWLWLLIFGLLLIGIATFFVETHGWLLGILLGVGGLVVVFASSEMMIMAVDGYAKRKKMNSFVAGTMAGLSSNIPELVMLAFVLMATPRVGFIVTILTLHVGAAAFGLYCGALPRDVEGNAHLPKPLVGLSTDLYAAAAGVLYGTYYHTADPFMGLLFGLKAFVAAVLGGIGSIPGAMVGGLILGISEISAVALGFSSMRDAIAFSILIIILLVKPAGLFGRATKEKV